MDKGLSAAAADESKVDSHGLLVPTYACNTPLKVIGVQKETPVCWNRDGTLLCFVLGNKALCVHRVIDSGPRQGEFKVRHQRTPAFVLDRSVHTLSHGNASVARVVMGRAQRKHACMRAPACCDTCFCVPLRARAPTLRALPLAGCGG